MRVLYVLGAYSLSETYITTEIRFAQRSGIEPVIWTQETNEGDCPTDAPTQRGGDLAAAIRRWKPDIAHFQFVSTASGFLDALPKGLPVTVRVHPVDCTLDMMQRVMHHPAVHRIFMFPSFAKDYDHPKIVPMTVAFDPERVRPARRKDWNLVYRIGGGREGKDLEGFVQVAARCRESFTFVLGMTRTPAWAHFFDKISQLNKSLGSPVEIRANVPHDEAAKLAGEAGVCHRSHEPGYHKYGMPMGIAEAMASGNVVLCKDAQDVRDYVGKAGLYYDNHEEAAERLLETKKWTESERSEAVGRSIDRARPFEASTALAPLLEGWEACPTRSS